MTELDIASRNDGTLETAPTRYIEGGGIRFAYRRLGPSAGTPLLCASYQSHQPAWSPLVS